MKRSITIAGHRTSVWIEDPFWEGLGEIASQKGTSTAALIAEIDRQRAQKGNLSSAIRLFVLERFRERRESTPAG